MKKNLFLSLLAISGLFFFSSCKKSHSVEITPFDATVAMAASDTSVNFSNYKTIAIADSVEVINNGIVSKELTGADESYRLNLTDSLAVRGFTIVPLSSSPDLVLNLTKIIATSDGQVDSSSYWQNYQAYYDPAAYNLPGLSYTDHLNQQPITLNGQALSFELLDLKNAAALNSINILWDGVVDGTDDINTESDAQPAIAALLAKSSYLVTQ